MSSATTSPADENTVFISYAHADAERIAGTLEYLKAQGIKVWKDDGIQPGINWQSEIAEAINDCALFLIFVSPSSVQSSHCNRELNFAVSNDKPMLAIHLEETRSPAWELALSDRQAILKYELIESDYLQLVGDSVTRLLSQKEVLQPRVIARKRTWKLLYALPVALIFIAFIVFQQFNDAPADAEVFNPSPNSVAVLPFSSLSEIEQDYFAEGMTEEILNALANINGLQVIARTSSFNTGFESSEVTEIGRQLNVSKILRGSIRRADNSLRISVQLLDTEFGEHVWSRSYDRELEQVFEIQKDISSAVAEMMEVTFFEEIEPPGGSETINVAAYDHYLLGRYHLNARSNDSIDQAIEHFEMAIETDPDFIPSYSGLADSYYLLNTYGNLSRSETISLMNGVMESAPELVEENWELLTSSGSLNRLRGLADRAENDYRAALEINANSAMTYMWLGNVLVNENRITEASEAYESALRLDPLNTAVLLNLGRMKFFLGEGDEGFEYLERAAAIDPSSQLVFEQSAYWMSHYGRVEEAVEAALESLRLDPEGTANMVVVLDNYLHLGAFDEARFVLEHAIQTGSDSWRILWSRSEFHYYSGEIDEMDSYLQGRLRALDQQFIEDRKIALIWAGVARFEREEYQLAAQYLQEGLEDNPVIDATARVFLLGVEAQAYQRLGDTELADEVLSRIDGVIESSLTEGLQQPELLVRISEIRAIQGNIPEALAALRQATDNGFKRYLILEASSGFDALRNEPEFIDILARLRNEAQAVRDAVREGTDFDSDIVAIIR